MAGFAASLRRALEASGRKQLSRVPPHALAGRAAQERALGHRGGAVEATRGGDGRLGRHGVEAVAGSNDPPPVSRTVAGGKPADASVEAEAAPPAGLEGRPHGHRWGWGWFHRCRRARARAPSSGEQEPGTANGLIGHASWCASGRVEAVTRQLVGSRSSDDDRSRHRRAVNGAVVLVGARRCEHDLIGAAVAGLHDAVREDR